MIFQEFINYCIGVAAQTAKEPTAQPFLDAQNVIQDLFPVVMRETVRRRAARRPHFQNLVKAHGITLLRGVGDLPAGAEEEFFEFASVGLLTKILNRSIAQLAKEGGGDDVEANDGDFAALTDVGLELVVTVDDAEVVRAIIEEVVSADSVKVRDYETGSSDTIVAEWGTGEVFEKAYVLVRTIEFVGKEAAGQTVAADAGTGLGSSDDIGRMMTIETDGEITVRAIITDVPGEDEFTIAGFAETVVASGTGTAKIYRAAAAEDLLESQFNTEMLDLFSYYPQYQDFAAETDTLLPRFSAHSGQIFVNINGAAPDIDIALFAVTVPQTPASAEIAISAPEDVLDEALVIAAGIIKGEIPIQSLGVLPSVSAENK